MKTKSNLACPNCESTLDRETALKSEGFIGFEGYKLLSCPCCIFFVDNSPHYKETWEQLTERAIELGATNIADEHRCHAEGCSVVVHPRMLMCRKHWYMVPKNLQQQIWQHYRPEQEITKTPSANYLTVAREAIAAVARREGKQ